MSASGRRLFNLANLTVVLIVLVLAGLLTWLLVRTLNAADAVTQDAERIARIGHGINVATDSVVQLHRTNQTAESILHHVAPVHKRLARIVGLARSIDGTAGGIEHVALNVEGDARTIDHRAGSILDTANAIHGTARNIDSTARGIDTTAGRIATTSGHIDTHAGRIFGVAGGIDHRAGLILRRAKKVDGDVRLINVFLEKSIGIAKQINDDTDNILFHGKVTHHYAACIDQEVAGRNSGDGDCQTKPAGEVAKGGS